MDLKEQLNGLKEVLNNMPKCKDGTELKKLHGLAIGFLTEIEENPELTLIESSADKDMIIDNLRQEITELNRDYNTKINTISAEHEDELNRLTKQIDQYEDTIKKLESQEAIEMVDKAEDLVTSEILDKLTNLEILVKSSNDSLSTVESVTRKMNLINNSTNKSVERLVKSNLNLTDYVKSYTKQSESTFNSVSKLKQDNENLNSKVEEVNAQYKEINKQYSDVNKNLEDTNNLVGELQDSVEQAVEEVKGFRAVFNKLRNFFNGKE